MKITTPLQSLIWISALIPFAAFAGPYLDAARAHQLCSSVGADIGARAHNNLDQSGYRSRLEKSRTDIRNLEEEIKAGKKAKVKTPEQQAAGYMLAISKRMHAMTLVHGQNYRAIHVEFSVKLHGSAWADIAGKVWDEVLETADETDARQLGYAVCMDYIVKG